MAIFRSNEMDDIKELVRALAMSKPVESGKCEGWTNAHLNALRIHNLTPWLHIVLQSRPQLMIPSELAQALQEDYARSAMRTLHVELSLRRLVREFESNGIPVVLLKGAYLGSQIYRDIAQRPMGDVDILVTEDRRDQAKGLLRSLGYTIYVEPVDEFELILHPALGYVKQGRYKEFVDLHWELHFMDHFRFPSSIVWNNTVSSSLFGHRVRFLHAELNFIHLAAHLLGHANGLRNWLDLIVLSRKTVMNWERMEELAASLHFVQPLSWVLRQLKEQWDFNPCPSILRRLGTYKLNRMDGRVIQGQARLVWRYYSRLKFLPDWDSRMRYVRSRVIPPPAYRRTIVGTRSLIGYILVRALGLVSASLKSR